MHLDKKLVFQAPTEAMIPSWTPSHCEIRFPEWECTPLCPGQLCCNALLRGIMKNLRIWSPLAVIAIWDSEPLQLLMFYSANLPHGSLSFAFPRHCGLGTYLREGRRVPQTSSFLVSYFSTAFSAENFYMWTRWPQILQYPSYLRYFMQMRNVKTSVLFLKVFVFRTESIKTFTSTTFLC